MSSQGNLIPGCFRQCASIVDGQLYIDPQGPGANTGLGVQKWAANLMREGYINADMRLSPLGSLADCISLVDHLRLASTFSNSVIRLIEAAARYLLTNTKHSPTQCYINLTEKGIIFVHCAHKPPTETQIIPYPDDRIAEIKFGSQEKVYVRITTL